MFERQTKIEARNTERDFDLIKRKLFTPDGGMNLNISVGDEDDETLKEDLENAQAELNTALKAPATLPTNSNGKPNQELMINDTPISSKAASDFLINFIQNPAAVTQSFRIWLPRFLFFMMPLTMLIGAIFIRGRGNAMLYDHIIHAAYIHSVAFFLLFLGIIMSYMIPGDIAAKALSIALLIYLPLSLRRMFSRGWLKTIWTSYGVGFIYMIILFMGMTSILIKSFSDTVGIPA